VKASIVALLVTVALGIPATPLAADAQQPSKVVRIGYLEFGSAAPLIDAFRQGLRELGYVEDAPGGPSHG
jgi:ABC-type proline/glycine betaine transport system substrate-binding protein